jgi:hypothetical protein
VVTQDPIVNGLALPKKKLTLQIIRFCIFALVSCAVFKWTDVEMRALLWKGSLTVGCVKDIGVVLD